MTDFSPQLLESAVREIAAAVEFRLRGRRNHRPAETELWSELSACILSSQVPYGLALAAADRLDHDRVFLDSDLAARQRTLARITCSLSTPLEVAGTTRKYRFPNLRAAQLASAWNDVRKEHGSLSAFLDNYADPDTARLWLVHNVPGIGPKQASMFLRNVGHTYDLAVIDRHVLRYMFTTGLCHSNTTPPVALGRYQDFEKRLRAHAEGLGSTVGIIDWAIWIVMRAAQELGRS